MSGHIETVVLDSKGLSAWVAQDRKVLTMFQVFHDLGADLVVSANTIVAVSHARVNLPRLQWALSRGKVEPITEAAAKAAAQLLKAPVCTDTSTRSTPRSRKGPCVSLVRSPSSRRMSTT